jgi:hypothetical protein
MILSDQVYYRIPQFWLFLGILFLLLGLAAGPDFRFFYANLLLSAICIGRSFQIYQYRRKISRRNRTTVLTETQKIERDTP